MTRTVRIEAEIDAATDSQLESYAANRGQSKAALIGEAVQRYVEYERWFQEQVRVGLEALEAGDTIPDSEIEKELHRRRER